MEAALSFSTMTFPQPGNKLTLRTGEAVIEVAEAEVAAAADVVEDAAVVIQGNSDMVGVYFFCGVRSAGRAKRTLSRSCSRGEKKTKRPMSEAGGDRMYPPPPTSLLSARKGKRRMAARKKSSWLGQWYLYWELPPWIFYSLWITCILCTLYAISLYYNEHHHLDYFVRTAQEKQQQGLAFATLPTYNGRDS